MAMKKNTFLGIQMRKSPKKSLFFVGKIFGGTRHLCEKNKPTLNRYGGGGGGCMVNAAGLQLNISLQCIHVHAMQPS